MGSWRATWNHYVHHSSPSTPPVYSRDFAYSNNEPVVLVEPMRMSQPRDNINHTSAKTFADLLSGPTVDIFVGQERKHWSLHQNLLCHHSPYFRAEFQGHEVSRKHNSHSPRSLDLVNDNPRGFELLVKWLYRGELEDPTSFGGSEQKYEHAIACHKLYLLADQFSMISLKNLAMDNYRLALYQAGLVPDAKEINEIYRSSPPKSPFRRLMTQIAARQAMDPGVKERDAENYRCCFERNADFAVEMVNAIRKMSGGGTLFDDPTEGQNCAWHEHEGKGSCSQTIREEISKAEVTVVKVESKASTKPKLLAVQADRDPIRTTPMAELPTDRRTPRKLPIIHTTPHPRQASAVVPRRTVEKQNNGHGTPRSAPVTPIKRNTAMNGDQTHPPRLLSPPPLTSVKPKHQPNESMNGHHSETMPGPRKLRSPTRIRRSSQTNETVSNSASSIGGPRKLGHVNGVVKQLNGVNGVHSSHGTERTSAEDAQSQAGASDMTERKAAPKLKRKAPG